MEEKELEHKYEEFIWMVNAKFGQHSAKDIDDMTILKSDERNDKLLPKNWQGVKDSYKIHKCIQLTIEQEQSFHFLRNHEVIQRMYEQSRVDNRERNWEYLMACRTGKQFIAKPQADALTYVYRKGCPPKVNYIIKRDPDNNTHVFVPGGKEQEPDPKFNNAVKRNIHMRN